MARIRILTGGGRYGDPWHPFAKTSAAVVEALEGAGHDVTNLPDEPDSLRRLADVDLVVVNLGGQPMETIEPDAEWSEAQAEFGDWIRAGGRVLGLHTASNAFPDWPEWPELLGGRWVRGTSMHPERCIATFEPAEDASHHAVWNGLDTVAAYDERYSDLEVFEGSTPLVRHETAEQFQVMGWAKGDRVIYDGMGHCERSYQSPSRIQFLLNQVDWLLNS